MRFRLLSCLHPTRSRKDEESAANVSLDPRTTCLLALALGPATAEARLPRLANGYELAIKPATVYGWTFDGSRILGGPSSNLPEGYGEGSFGYIRWKLWGSHRARGKGVVWSNSCSPSCGNGTWAGRATRVSAYRVRGGHFTRMKFSSVGAAGHHPHAVFGYRRLVPPEWEILRQWRSGLVADEEARRTHLPSIFVPDTDAAAT